MGIDDPSLLSRRHRFLTVVKGQRRIVAIIMSFVVLICAMVAYNGWGLARERMTPLVVDVTSRQRTYVERYIKDVLLTLDGEPADPHEDQRALELSADSLLHGGLVPAPQGGFDDLVRIPAPASATIRIKLAHERDLIHQLVDEGQTLMLVGKDSPSYAATLFLVRLTAAQLSSVTADAAAEEARVARDSLNRLLWVEVALGLLGAVAAMGMGLLLWRAAKKQSERFRSLVHNSLDLITVIDERSIALYQSPSSNRVLGYAPADVVGSKLTDLLHPSDKGRVVKAFADIYDQAEATAALQFRLRHRNGTWVTMEGTVVNMLADRAVGGFVVNTRDVTERERVAAELATVRDAALEASQMKSQFLASMSHEIRTPMNAVIGLSELLADTPLNPEQRRYVTGVQGAAEGLLGIINDILDFSKVEAGKLQLESVDLDLGLLLEDVIGLFADSARAQSLELLVHRHPGLPTALRGDPTRLRQVLVNLVSNAVKFTSEGEVVLSAARVAETPTDATIRFEVSDTGLGIAAEDQRRMFDPFSQADSSTTRRFGGTGLGLAIVRQLVELMGGRLGLDSQVNRGSRFWFELPLAKQDAPIVAMEPRFQDLGSLRVLVVDDNATNRLILHQQLSSWGMDPDEEAGGQAALMRMHAADAQGRGYDVVILDLNMPEMDGLELARRIGSDAGIGGAKLFLLSSSGKVSDQVAQEYRLSGALAKPVRQSELFNCLASGLGLRPETVTPAIGPPSERLTGRGRLLLVEDNAMNQLVATKIIEKLGFTVDIADNGIEALKIIAVNHYDAILMDCQMPEMDGYETTTEIRRREHVTGRHIPIIAMTAAAMEGDRERCLAAGMDDYVTKPVRTVAVDAVLAHWVTARADSETEPRTGVAPAADESEIEGIEATGSEPAILDPVRLALLRELDDGDGTLLTALVTEYRADSARLLAAIGGAIDEGDPQIVEQAAHTLKGASANLGANDLAELAGTLEAFARAGALATGIELLESMRAEHRRACVALDELFVGF